MPARFWSIDFLRGIAVSTMVVFHFLFDYDFFARGGLDLYSGAWFWLGRLAAVLFVFLAGMSVVFWGRRHAAVFSTLAKRMLSRGLLLLGAGMLITLFTWLFFPRYAIWFGVLHLLGTATILSVPLVSKPRLALVAGALIALIGVAVSMGALIAPRLLGMFDFAFATFDYFPLFPWLGVFWLGLFAGDWGMRNASAWFSLPAPAWPLLPQLRWLGCHSLAVYFAHQPILVALLLLATQGPLKVL
jgi:uncharacterized membrane protein